MSRIVLLAGALGVLAGLGCYWPFRSWVVGFMRPVHPTERRQRRERRNWRVRHQLVVRERREQRHWNGWGS